MIALIDYGAGNLTSVRKALAALGAGVTVPREPAELAEATAVIVPGVGHFAATARLTPPWRDAIRAAAAAGRPLLGICLGMQWLFEASTEAPTCSGLGWLTGTCARLDARGSGEAANGQPIKIPHVGWNQLQPSRPSALLDGIEPGSYVYFTHSYAAPVGAETIAVTEHGQVFASAVEHGRVAGVQFHPEKSGDVGLKVLSNFLAWTAG